MAHTTANTPTRIDDTLVLHGVADAVDAARFAAFNAEVNGADQGATCAALLQHHPTAAWDDFVIVEDERSRQVVSTTCLIPWRLQLGGVSLTAAMLEMVVTHPDYRRRGLVRRQIDHFHSRAAAQDFDLCIIEGIPYYYRQFGYAYALDHWAADALPSAWIPAGAPEVRLRRATLADIPALMQSYTDAAANTAANTTAGLALHTQRDAEYWRYLLQGASYPVYMVEPLGETAQDAARTGYVCGWQGGDPTRISLVESALPSAAAALAVLQLCKPHAAMLHLGWPQRGMLVQVARTLGGRPHGGDQWLVRTPDLPRLLLKLAPVWAGRLAEAGWPRLTGELTLNLYRQAYRLRFAEGRLTAVDALGFVDASMGAQGGDLCIPPDAFTRLLFGYRSLDELRDAWPDIVVQPARRHLVDALFPRLESYVWLPYMNCAHLPPLLFP